MRISQVWEPLSSVLSQAIHLHWHHLPCLMKMQVPGLHPSSSESDREAGNLHLSISSEILIRSTDRRWLVSLPYLGLRANAIAGEGILPLRQAQVRDEQAIVSGEGVCEKMPV